MSTLNIIHAYNSIVDVLTQLAQLSETEQAEFWASVSDEDRLTLEAVQAEYTLNKAVIERLRLTCPEMTGIQFNAEDEQITWWVDFDGHKHPGSIP